MRSMGWNGFGLCTAGLDEHVIRCVSLGKATGREKPQARKGLGKTVYFDYDLACRKEPRWIQDNEGRRGYELGASGTEECGQLQPIRKHGQ